MSYFGNDYYSLYLEHHGILGQKWGVRRYQNKDGSLTSAGKKRLFEKKDYSVANKTNTYLGNAKETFEFLGKSAYEELTDYGKHNAMKASAKEFTQIYQDAFNDDPEAQRKALKVSYASAITRYMDEESSDPLAADVFKKYVDDEDEPRSAQDLKASREYELNVGNSWGKGQEDEWREEIEKNVEHKIDSLSSSEKAQALFETGLYSKEDAGFIKSINLSPEEKKEIQAKVTKAKKNNSYDMEFMEKELDLDPYSGEPLKGKALETAYEDYLKRKF